MKSARQRPAALEGLVHVARVSVRATCVLGARVGRPSTTRATRIKALRAASMRHGSADTGGGIRPGLLLTAVTRHADMITGRGAALLSCR